MRVSVEGVITSIEEASKQDPTKGVQKFTNLLLAQKGEKVQVAVRLPGHVAKNYTEFEIGQFSGRLMAWSQRDGVGMMVTVPEESF